MSRANVTTKEQRTRFISHLRYGESDRLTTEVAYNIISAHAWKNATTKGRLKRVLCITQELLQIMEEL